MKRNNKRSLAVFGLVTAGLAGAVVATGWGWQTVGNIRREAARQEQRLAQLPAAQARAAVIQAEVAKRQADVARIEAFVVPKDQLAYVVSDIEVLGRTRGIAVSVPAVEEKIDLDEQGREIAARGPIAKVRLKISATGAAKELIHFLHDLEHMQRLTYLESWRLDASEKTARSQAAVRADTNSTPVALLLADFVVAVKREAGEE